MQVESSILGNSDPSESTKNIKLENLDESAQKIEEAHKKENVLKPQKRIFLSAINSLFSHAFVRHFSMVERDFEALIVGVLNANDSSPAPVTVEKAFDAGTSFKDLFHVCNDCSTIVIETMHTDLNFVNRLSCYFDKNFFFERKKVLVMSHPILWCQNEAMTVTSPQQFWKRRTLPCFQIHKLIEEKLIGVAENNPSVETIVLIPGVPYGRGEDNFFSLFQDCLNKKNLSVFDEGKNILSVVLIDDLARAAEKLCFNICEQKIYYICEDKLLTQKELVVKTAECLSLEVRNGDSIEDLLREDYKIMNLEVAFKTSPFLEDCLTPGWSLGDNIQKIYEQFLHYRGVKSKIAFVLAPQFLLNGTSFLEDLRKKTGDTIFSFETLVREVKGSSLPADRVFLEEFAPRLQHESEKIAEEMYKLAMEEFITNRKLKKKVSGEPKREHFIFGENEERTLDLTVELFKHFFSNLSRQNSPILFHLLPAQMQTLQPLLNFLNEGKFDVRWFALLRPSSTILEVMEKEAVENNTLKRELHACRHFPFDVIAEEIQEKDHKWYQMEIEDLTTEIRLGELSEEVKNIAQPSSFEPQETLQSQEQFQETLEKIETVLTSTSQPEEDELAVCSANLTQYLSETIFPDITEIIVDICAKKPLDPVKYLIDSLRSKIDQSSDAVK